MPGRRVSWPRIHAALDRLGPLPGGSRVTLEPGGQVELSGPPMVDVGAAVADVRADRRLLVAALHASGLGLAALGTDPLRPGARGHPGPRDAAVGRHFTAAGRAPPRAASLTY